MKTPLFLLFTASHHYLCLCVTEDNAEENRSLLFENVEDKATFVDNTVDTEEEESDENSLSYYIRQAVFLPLVRSYLFRSKEDLAFPAKYGLDNADNIYIPLEGGDGRSEGFLGAWFIRPNSGAAELEDLEATDCLVIYMHGNSMDRGFGHRVKLYELFISLGCHVLTFDYRSYGDSSKTVLSEISVVEDARAVLSWVAERLKPEGVNNTVPHVLVWGHSLGTAISSRALAEVQLSWVKGLVLESPFNTMEDEITNFKLSWLTNLLSWWVDITEELEKAGVEFLTEKHLPLVSVPVLVLHSEDDPVVPVALGRRLVDQVQAAGKEDVQLVTWGREHRLRHRYIFRAPGIEKLVQTFLEETKV